MPAQQITPQGAPPPEAMMPPDGMMPQGGMAPSEAGVEQMGGGELPPEILALLSQEGGMPPGM
jgi:hypothetical protein